MLIGRNPASKTKIQEIKQIPQTRMLIGEVRDKQIVWYKKIIERVERRKGKNMQ